MGYIRKVP